jgi:hypothetical protein
MLSAQEKAENLWHNREQYEKLWCDRGLSNLPRRTLTFTNAERGLAPVTIDFPMQ